MWPSVEQLEAIGKIGIGMVAICAISFLFYKSLERTAREHELVERQVTALEKLVKVYSGEN